MRTLLALLLLIGCAGPDSAAEAQDLTPASAIKHIIVIVQENHSFDSYFGTYCTAPAGSSPTCTDGPSCCEAAPASDPGTGIAPVQLTDWRNAAWSPDHTRACETTEVDSGAMDRFVSAACGSSGNFALASDADVPGYRGWAQQYALADRYFQPILGASSSNDMYLSTTTMMFIDNAYMPRALGASCASSSPQVLYSGGSIGDLLSARGVSWTWYIEGYADARAAKARGACAPVPADCPAGAAGYPCTYDPSDIPAAYFKSSVDNPAHMRDFAQLQKDLAAGALPSVVFVKGLGYHTEHPGSGVTISAGEQFVGSVLSAVQGSVHAATTLVLVTWDESGGYFDHLAPPRTPAGWQPYGPRVPLLALGPFARKNHVSHVTMEHSSIVRFIEWNWLGKTGLLHQRDGSVNNIGSLLDPAATKVQVP